MGSRSVRALAVCALLSLFAVVVTAAVSISTSPYSQPFDGMGTVAVATVPADFRVDRTASAVRTPGVFASAGNQTTAAGGGNLSTTASNGIYNFGSGINAAGSDRAIGFLSSGTNTGSGNLYVQLRNDSGGPLSGLRISYDVEKYRNGTNAAGFCIQMFSSTDGSTWTNAGSSFRTAFPADANNNGFTPAPGATVSVDQTLSTAIAAGADYYLAWNYAVCTGSTTTNAQALAVDNVSITGIADQQRTNPTGTLQASSTTLAPGDSLTLIATITPGSNPTSTGVAVSADLSAIGLGIVNFSPAGGNTFSFTGTIPANQPTSSQTVNATITDAEGRSGTTAPAVFLSVQPPASTSPSGTGSATPASVPGGGSTRLSVQTTPGTNPTSTGITVTGDLTAIGGSNLQPFTAAGNGAFTFDASVSAATAPGTKSLPITIADNEGRVGTLTIPLTVTARLVDSTIVISQIYGGGGNNGAIYQNDFVELYNSGGQAVDVSGWSLQYASAAGTIWNNKQILGGVIAPGEYYLVALAGGVNGQPLPAANMVGSGSTAINMSATTGKIALVDTFEELEGACPLDTPNAHIRDFVGYGGTASCQEGSTRAPAGSNATALFRADDGKIDTDGNGRDFVAATPAPRRTAPIVELGPFVAGTDPRSNLVTVPRDATIVVTFSEPVTLTGAWFDISCSLSGAHTDATFASDGQAHYITPNVNFIEGEQCTTTVFKDRVSDEDLDDSAPGTDTMKSNYVWSFKIATGTAAPEPPSVHLTLGNPSGAIASTSAENNFLMEKPEFTLSYNRGLGRPNWVSWHLSDEWVGSLTRVDTFRADPAIPPDWYRVQSFDFSGSGFDRGHMVPNADRDKETSIPINQATFLMTNMVAQAPDNNQGPWANMENALRLLLPANELYIVAGGTGTGGFGANGGETTTLADGHVTVPKDTWKVALVLQKAGGDDLTRVTCSARTIAVIMPNRQGIRNDDWQNYLTTVDAVETLTGYNLFSNLPVAVQQCVEASTNGTNNKKNVPTFTDLGPATVELGTASVLISGSIGLDVVAGAEGITRVVPPGTVAVSLNGVTVNAPIGLDGRFTAALPGGGLTLANGPYVVGFSYAGDANFEPAAATSSLRVVDATAPTILGISATPDSLGPPNHKLIDVTVNYSAIDLGGAPVCSLSVSSNESANGLGDGNTSTDWFVVDTQHVRLRAERSGLGDGRQYFITATCTDGSGNASSATTIVSVPR